MYEITYRLVGGHTNQEYKVTAERLEEARFIWESLAYCRSLYIVTSSYPR